MFCCLASVWAQQTSLVVDNQTPGWLSSKIPFADQATVKNLKVTGYLNGTDIKFIRELTELRNVVHLDLSDANIVAGGDAYYSSYKTSDNILTTYMFNFKDVNGSFLSVPKSISESYSGFLQNKVDTLVYGGNKDLIIKGREMMGLDSECANYVYFREGVDSICDNSMFTFKKVHLPLTVKNIWEDTFASTSYLNQWLTYEVETIDINFTNELEYIDHKAFAYLNIKADTIRFSNKMTIWNTCSFKLRNGQVIYIPQSIKTIDNSCDDGNVSVRCERSIYSDTELQIYVESAVPPTIKNYSSGAFKSCVVHVPTGCAEVYKNAEGWKDATIIEEIPVTGISINKPKAKVYVGDRIKLDVNIMPENADNKNFTSKSLDENVAIVDEQGNVTAKSYGKARIMATSEDGEFTDVCEFDVYEHATGVSLSSSALKMKIGEKQTLIATIMPEGKTDGQMEWRSSDTDVAEVDAEGVVKAKAKGKATITVTTVDGRHTASCEIQVYQPVTSLNLNNETLTLKTGETQQLIASISPSDADNKNVIWSSENVNVASVDKEGRVTGVKSGQVWIYAKSEDDETVKVGCYVTVIQPVTGLTLDKSSISFSQIGESEQLTAIIQPEDATNKEIEWSSSDQSVAVVSNGLVICSGVGSAVIYATTKDGGFTASCSVHVYKPVTSLDLDINTLTLNVGDDQQLRVNVFPTDADNKNVIWSSENEDIAYVDDYGKVTGVKAGQVWIYVKSEADETIKDGCYVKVIQPVTGLKLDKSNISFTQIGESEQITAIVQPEDATNKDINWSSSDQSVAIVNNGLVVCSGFGTAVIYATTIDGGYMATCVVNATQTSGVDDVSIEKKMQIVNGHVLLRGFAAGTNVTVCDTAGRVLYSTKISASGCVDISNIGRGMFIINIGNNTYKVIL